MTQFIENKNKNTLFYGKGPLSQTWHKRQELGGRGLNSVFKKRLISVVKQAKKAVLPAKSSVTSDVNVV